MSEARRTSTLVGLLVASLVAGGLAGAASAGQATAPTADASATVDGSDALAASHALALQSRDNSSENTTIHYEGAGLTLRPSAGETITGETEFAPGTKLEILVASEDDEAPFLESADVTVADNGTFAGTVDLSQAPGNLPITVEVRRDRQTITEVEGTITRCTENCSGPEEWPAFREDVFQTGHGETVDVGVAVPPGTDGPVNLTLGDENANFLVETRVVDADGDGRITVTLDTGAAGTGSPGEYLSAGDDRIESARQRTDAIGPPLDPGNYALEVGPREAPYDIATLAIQEPSSDDGGEESSLDVETTGEVTFITAGDTLTLGNVENQRIKAETELEPGTTVHLQITSADASNPFLLSPTANVTEYGTINATVDLSEIEPGSGFELVARNDSEKLGATRGRIVECEDGCPGIASGPNRSAATNGSANDAPNEDNQSNVVEVNDGGGSLPVEGLLAIGVGGLLSLLGLVRFTGLLKR